MGGRRVTREKLGAALALVLAAGVAGTAGGAERLTAAGARLDPIACPAGLPCEVAIDAGGDTVIDVHVVLRPASSNIALARDRDGFWAPWDGDPAKLPPAAALRDGDLLVFKLFQDPPSGLASPYTVTLAYRTPDGLRLGWFEVSTEGEQ